MIVMYRSAGCLSCRKVEAWLLKNNLEFTSVNLLGAPMKKEDLKFLLTIADDVYDVLSVRSNPVMEYKATSGKNIEDMTFNQLLDFLQENPNAIRRPLITDGKVLVSGFNEDELTRLLPRNKRFANWTADFRL